MSFLSCHVLRARRSHAKTVKRKTLSLRCPNASRCCMQNNKIKNFRVKKRPCMCPKQPGSGSEGKWEQENKPKTKWYRSFSLKRAGISSYKLVACVKTSRGMSIIVACTVRASSRAQGEGLASSPLREVLTQEESSHAKNGTMGVGSLAHFHHARQNAEVPNEGRDASSRKWGRGKVAACRPAHRHSIKEPDGGRRPGQEVPTSDGPWPAAFWREKRRGEGWTWKCPSEG